MNKKLSVAFWAGIFLAQGAVKTPVIGKIDYDCISTQNISFPAQIVA